MADVLVVGAEPTGLTPAASLAAVGVQPRLVDRDPDRVHESRVFDYPATHPGGPRRVAVERGVELVNLDKPAETTSTISALTNGVSGDIPSRAARRSRLPLLVRRRTKGYELVPPQPARGTAVPRNGETAARVLRFIAGWAPASRRVGCRSATVGSRGGRQPTLRNSLLIAAGLVLTELAAAGRRRSPPHRRPLQPLRLAAVLAPAPTRAHP